jgi:hypothetical protein
MTTRYAVRCCCQPSKVLGFINGPDECRAFAIRTLPVNNSTFVGGCEPPAFDAGFHQAEVRDIWLPDRMPMLGMPATGRYEKAVYSDDRGIEFWRTVQGFEEAPAGTQ